jgi:hypothetical protein
LIKTTLNLFKLGKSIAVGMTVGQMQRLIATRFRMSKDDPLYHHWYLALDSLIVASRDNFDQATQALLREMDNTRKNPVSPKVFKATPN